MTADEVVTAGGLTYTNSPKAYYYLAKDGTSSIIGNKSWWTMSPSNCSASAYTFSVSGSIYPGYLSSHWGNTAFVVRPVVSLKAEVEVTGGDGNANNPYIVTLP